MRYQALNLKGLRIGLAVRPTGSLRGPMFDVTKSKIRPAPHRASSGAAGQRWLGRGLSAQ